MALTVDEQMARVMDRVPVLRTGDVNGNRNFIRNVLLEVARDQRHACAEAVLDLSDETITSSAAHAAAMNAEIKAWSKGG